VDGDLSKSDPDFDSPLLVHNERHTPDALEKFWVALMVAAPISSLAALLTLKPDQGWLGLYFKRKELEEKLKGGQNRSGT
jgi:hypothetical protein